MPNAFGGRENLEAIAFLEQLNEVVHGREPGVGHGRRGVDRLARRLAADVPRRARLRLQVEHGLDARHAGVLPARPGLPQLPPRRADVQPRCTPSARTSSCRSRTTRSCTARARCSTRCPATAGSSSPTCARCTATCGRIPGKKLLFMGGELAQEREWSHDRSLDWHLLERPEHRGVQTLVGDLNRRLPRRAGALGGRRRARRVRAGSS